MLAAVILRASPEPALFVVAAGALALLAVGIHNSWDAVTYHVVESTKRDAKRGKS